MTGKSNKRNYIRFGLLDRSQTTFANLLKKAGYRTCIAGKWQLGREPDAPQHFGFETALLWQHTRGRVDKRQHDTRYPNPKLERDGRAVDYNSGEFSSDLFVDFINEFMQANRDHPFLVYYPMALVHCPFGPTPESTDWNPDDRGSKTYKGKPEYFSEMVAYVDKCVKRIDGKLEELGIRDNTLLIFTGDNGTDTPIVTRTTTGEIAGAKGQMIDAGNHVTCIVSWPEMIREGRVTDDLIDFSDVLPTICAAGKVPIPEDLTIDGVSFLPQILGEKGTPRDSIFMWYSRDGKVHKARAFARNQRYKLYASGKLFDVPSDPLEKHPLDRQRLSPESRGQVRMLEAHLKQFRDVIPPQARR